MGKNVASEDPPPSKKAKRRQRGQNKHRPRTKVPFSEQLCPSLHSGATARDASRVAAGDSGRVAAGDTAACQFGDTCRYMHDIPTYLASKPPDLGKSCILYETFGRCLYGLACRFGGVHITPDHRNVTNMEVFDPQRADSTVNVISKTLQERLRKRTLKFPRSEAYLESLSGRSHEGSNVATSDLHLPSIVTDAQEDGAVTSSILSGEQSFTEGAPIESSIQSFTGDTSSSIQSTEVASKSSTCHIGAITDVDMVRLRQVEKRKVS